MKYIVKYTSTTHSRYGNYVYHFSEEVEAITPEEAITKVKSMAYESKSGHWKFRVSSVKIKAE